MRLRWDYAGTFVVTQSDCCEADYVRSEEINHHISAVTSSSEIEVAADLSSSKAAAVLELSSADLIVLIILHADLFVEKPC